MLGPEIKLDLQGIDACLTALLILKQNKGQYQSAEECYGDGLWTTDVLRRLNELVHWSENQWLISEAKETLQSLKSIEVVLAGLTASLKEATMNMETALEPFQLGRGLDSLSDDILSIIFEFTGFESRETLCLVCRRFCRIASRLPQLWSYVSDEMENMQQVYAALENSKTVGLEVDLYLDMGRPNERPLEVLDAVLLHKERWESLNISTNGMRTGLESQITDVSERLMDISLPRLERLVLEYPYEPEFHGALYSPNSALHFYASLSVPNLRYLSVDNFIPVAFPLPSLTSLRILLRGDEEDYSLRCLFEFLSSLPQLEDLHLILGGRFEDELNSPQVLRKVKSLRLDVLHSEAQEVSPVVKALVTPALRTMHLRAEQYHPSLESGGGLSEWLEILLCQEDYSTVEELTFEFFDHGENSKYTIPFEKFPNLKKLSLDTMDWHPIFPWDEDDTQESHIPPLRTLCLKGTDYRWVDWLEEVHERMDASNQLPEFQNLEIETVDDWNVEHVERMFTGKRISWGSGNGQGKDTSFE